MTPRLEAAYLLQAAASFRQAGDAATADAFERDARVLRERAYDGVSRPEQKVVRLPVRLRVLDGGRAS